MSASFGQRRFDAFFAASAELTQQTYATTTVQGGGFTVAGEGNLVQVASSASIVAGVIAYVNAVGYFRVLDVPDATHVYLRPVFTIINDTGEYGIVGQVVANGTALTVDGGGGNPTARITALEGVVDLRDAPANQTYDYLLMAAAAVGNQVTANAQVRAEMRVNGLYDDPFASESGTGPQQRRRGPAAITVRTAGSGHRHSYVAACRRRFNAGQVYFTRLQMGAVTAGASATMRNPQILALRVNTAHPYYVDSGLTSGANDSVAVTNASAVTWVEATESKLTVPAGVTAGMKFLLVGSGLAGHDNATRANRKVEIELNGAAGGAAVKKLVEGTTDEVPFGVIRIVTGLVAGGTLAWRFRAVAGAGNASLRCTFMALVPLAAIYGGDSFLEMDPGAITTPLALTQAFQDVAVSTAANLSEAADTIEFISAVWGGTGGDNHNIVRPRFGGDPASYYDQINEPRGRAGHEGLNDERNEMAFWFWRGRHSAGSWQNRFQARVAGTGTALSTGAVHVCGIKEKARYQPLPTGDKVAVVAEVECGRGYRLWSVAGTDLFDRYCPELGLVTRVKRNGVDLTRAASMATVSGADDQWYWDIATKTVRVKLPAGLTPATAGQTIFVIESLLFCRPPAAVFTDTDGIERPYDPRLQELPTVTQRLDVRQTGSEAAVTFGTIRLSASDGLFDNLIRSGCIFKGLYARVYRGYRDGSNQLSDLDEVVSGIMDAPDLKPDVLTLKVADLGIQLARPVNKTLVAIYQSETQVNNFLLGTYYGWCNRIRAMRTTNLKNAVDANTYKICGHGIKALRNVWRSPTDQTAIASGITPNLAAGSFTVTNSSIDATGWPKVAPDVLYVDIQGVDLGAEGVFDAAGAIGENILTTIGTFTAGTIDRLSWRKLDRRDRVRRWIANAVQRMPVSIGLPLEGSELKAKDALLRLTKTVVAYLTQSRAGKARVRVPDYSAAGLLANPGFDLGVKWPWRSGGLASAVLNTTQAFEGSTCLEVSSGTWGDQRQTVTIEQSGWHVCAAVVANKTGDGNALRLFLIVPGDGYGRTLSPVFELSSQRYSRVSFPVYIEPGQIGSAVIGVVPYEPLSYEPEFPAIPGLRMWLRANRLSTADGGTLTTWTDLSGLGNSPTQATAARKPFVRRAALCGHAGVVFDQVDDVMVSPLAIAAPPVTTYVVLTSDGDAALRRAVAGSNAGWFIGPWFGVYMFSATGVLAGPAITPGRPVVLAFVQTSATLSEGFVNGVSVGTIVSGGQVAPGTVQLGHLTEPAGSTLFEVIVADEAHDAATVAAISRALQLMYGTISNSILLDSVDLVPVAAVITPRAQDEGVTYPSNVLQKAGPGPALNARVGGMGQRPDVIFETRVPYNPRLADWNDTPGVVTTDDQARGVLATYEPDKSVAAATLQSAGRLDHGRNRDVVIGNADETKAVQSALGISAPLAIRFSRQGVRAAVDMIGLDRMPEIGDMLYAPPTLRLGSGVIDDPFWLIQQITETSLATDVAIEAEQAINPIQDAGDIAPQYFPIGYMGIALTAGAITGWPEVTELRGKYLVAAAAAAISSALGSLFHFHTLLHAHSAVEHWHEYNATTIGPSVAGGTFDPAGRSTEDELEVGIYLGFDIESARGRSDGDHDHPATDTGDPNPHQAEHRPGLVSGNPISTIVTRDGPTEIKNKRVTVRRRTGGTDDIPTTICIGWLSATIPAGWVRETALDGYALKVADPLRTGTARTVQGGGFTVNGGAQTLTLNASSSLAVQVGSWIVLTKTGATNTLVVEAVLGGNQFTVRAVWLVGDAALATNYPAGSAATPVNETVGTTYEAPVQHDHGGAGAIPVHAHLTPHDHYEDWPQSSTPSPGTTEHLTGPSDPTHKTLSSLGALLIQSTVGHKHRYRPRLLTDNTPSGNAGGSITQTRNHQAPVYEFVWIKPNGGGIKEIPPGGIILGDGQQPPGFVRFGAADNFVLKGAATGQPSTGGTNGNHDHNYTADAHTYAHDHAEDTWSLGDDAGPIDGIRTGEGGGVWSAVGYRLGNSVGHMHRVFLGGITQPKPNANLLSSLTKSSGNVKGTGALPRYAPIILYQKL